MCFFQRTGDGYAMQGLMASSAYEWQYIPDASEGDLLHIMDSLKKRIHDFVIAYHHIVTDVVGLSIILKDLDRVYRMQPLDKASGGASPLDYAVYEAEQEASGGYEERLASWRAKFQTLPEPLPLLPPSALHTRPTRRLLSYAAGEEMRDKIHSEYRTLTPKQVAAVKAACVKLRVSPFHFYLAVRQVLLARLAQSEDVCIGLVDANRGNEKAAHIVGCFVNVLPIQAHIETKNRFREVARAASREALSAFANAGVPFDMILDTAAMNYRGAGWGELPLGTDCRMVLTLDDGKDAEPPYDVSLGVMEIADGRCALDLHCQSSLYSADATAEKPVVTDGNLTLTYAQLISRVNAASESLTAAGCIKGDRIASLCNPSVDSIVSMLAILQAGYVYVPLDTSLPVARMAAMAISVDEIPQEPTSEVRCVNNPAAAAILLFTSGSTGTPKGIVLTHGNFVNHLALKTQELGLGREVVLKQSSLGFDMSVVQNFCALANGGCLVVVPQETRRDPMQVVDLLCSHRISLTIATPSEYLAWVRSGCSSLQGQSAWKHACMGGEHVSKQLTKAFQRLDLNSLRLTNCYGPTEITAAATFQTISLDEDFEDGAGDDEYEEQHEQYLQVKYAVGKALPNYTLRILDTRGRPQPVQYTGEICIGGPGVAQGYLGLPDQKSSKFISNPKTGERLYRTGDQGRLLADGTLLCFGRIDGDTQVKLRGLRIELREVEAAVLKASNGRLADVVVLKQGDSLFAYATVAESFHENDNNIDEAELMRILGGIQLP
ncbi:Nonribosomal peptide synthetase 14 [Cytospora mali]|uniref:Nonribosomal peptide synthetase 14 n=1 Tax=Cytospora mali TaxID=578113 RepID=A0A194W6Q1_CYTMA|nr:Nonribosomal peptide synthetase 14 [Valsa mali]